MKFNSMKAKISLVSILLFAIGFIIMVVSSVKTMEKNIKSALNEQFIAFDTQIAAQAEILLKQNASVDELQEFISGLTQKNPEIAYAVLIDNTVTAVAHSDAEKIGKNYSDDTSYSVPACTEGATMTSQFWADVQNAWTYDVMVPIYIDGVQYGSMDVGIYNSSVDETVSAVRMTEILSAVILIAIFGVLIFLFINLELKDFNKIVNICDTMGNGNFTVEIDSSLVNRSDELGSIANSVAHMKNNLSSLINETSEEINALSRIEASLTELVENTKKKSNDIVSITEDAVGHTVHQKDISESNMQKTLNISEDINGVSSNISNISQATHETNTAAVNGAEQIQKVVAQMKKIGDNVTETRKQMHTLENMSGEIENIVEMIGDIASQTNLLSLNASIEAARAGEQGKGFAVVATEVGSLAIQSSKSADDIASMIKQIQESIQSCVSLMEEGYQSAQGGINLAEDTMISFSGITDKISQISTEMSNVATIVKKTSDGTSTLQGAMNEIENLAEQVSSNTENISNAVIEQNNMMEKVTSEINELTHVSESLLNSLKVFKISEN